MKNIFLNKYRYDVAKLYVLSLPNATAFGYRNVASTKLRKMKISNSHWKNNDLFHKANFE